MRTIPQTFRDHARDGSEFFYLIEILPRGSDSWSAMRFADYDVSIDGDAYLGGYIQNVDDIRYYANVRQGGGAASRDAVSFKLLNKTYAGVKLSRFIQANNIEGRDVRIYLAMLPLNLIRNSSFETPTSGNNFDNWIETAGSGSNTITRQSGGAFEASQFVRMVMGGTPNPTIQSDTFAVRRGTTVSLSFYAKAASGGQLVRAKVIWSGKYWNDSTRLWQASATHVNFTLTTSWARYSLPNILSATEPFTNADAAPMSVLFEVNGNGTVDLDAVQLEQRPRVSAYHRDRYYMLAADRLPVYWGEIRDPEWDRSIVTLKTKSVMNQRHKRIPIDKITNQWNADWQIPPDSIGKPFPITYGDLTGDPNTAAVHEYAGVLAVGRLVNSKHDPANLTPAIVYFDSPRTSISHAEQGRLYHQGDNHYFPALDDDQVTPKYVEFEFFPYFTSAIGDDNAGYLKSSRFAVSAYLRPRSVLSQGGTLAPFTSPENMLDLGDTTYAYKTLSTQNGTINAMLLLQQVNFPSKGDVIRICALISAVANASAGTIRLELELNRSDITYDSANVTIFSASGGSSSKNNVPWAGGTDRETAFPITKDSTCRHLGYFEASEEEACLNIFGSTLGFNATGELRIYEAGLRVDFCIALLDAKFCRPTNGRIRVEGTWGGRYSSGSHINSPSEVIEGLLRQELGIAGTSINTGTFDTTHTARSSWKLAGQVLEFNESIDVVDSMAWNGACLYYLDGAGKESLAPLGHGASVRAMTRHDYIDGSVTIGFTPREDVVNSFTLRYSYQPNLDEFRKTLYCNKDEQNIGDASYATKCADSYAALGDVEYPQEFEAKWIADDDTAIAFMKWLVNWLSARKRTLKASGGVDLLDLEHGDLTDQQLEEYLLEQNTDTTRPVFLPEKFTIKRGRVDIEYLEVVAP